MCKKCHISCLTYEVSECLHVWCKNTPVKGRHNLYSLNYIFLSFHFEGENLHLNILHQKSVTRQGSCPPLRVDIGQDT